MEEEREVRQELRKSHAEVLVKTAAFLYYITYVRLKTTLFSAHSTLLYHLLLILGARVYF